MTYRVIVSPNAEHDLREAYRYIRYYAPEAASRWIKGARRSIKTLARNPQRGPLAPESKPLGEPILELLYGKSPRGVYRILFIVFSESVYVLHVRHGSWDALNLAP
jgi:plasmid stabilization system protein ParE